jgi:hypothetical protein
MQYVWGAVAVVLAFYLILLLMSYVGMVSIVTLDTMASAFRVSEPATGWLVLGLCFGALFGLSVGLKKGGSAIGRPPFVVVAIVLSILLVSIGANSPHAETSAVTADTVASAPAQVAPTATKAPTRMQSFLVRVTAEQVNLHTEPDRDSPVVRVVARRQALRVLEVSAQGNWYRVDALSGKKVVTAWIASRYVTKMQAGESLETTRAPATPAPSHGADTATVSADTSWQIPDPSEGGDI